MTYLDACLYASASALLVCVLWAYAGTFAVIAFLTGLGVIL